MKLLTFRPPRARSGHFGVLLSSGEVLNLTALPGRAVPTTLIRCIQGGSAALDAVGAAAREAEARLRRGEQVLNVFGLDQVTLEPPLIPGKIMAVGKNYSEHAAETGSVASSRPNGFIKNVSCIVAHGATVRKPAWTDTFDYENELAVVIGTDCCEVAPEQAMDCVFGYTIMNDLSCRDVQYAERKEGNILIGKNFPTAAPLGPWVVTKDEIADPHNLRIVTRVNGEVRQDSTTANQIHRIPAQIAWFSHAGLEAGDIISTGSPGGTGAGYKGPGTWYLGNGDVVECEIEKIGTLSNTVSTRKRKS